MDNELQVHDYNNYEEQTYEAPFIVYHDLLQHYYPKCQDKRWEIHSITHVHASMNIDALIPCLIAVMLIKFMITD